MKNYKNNDDSLLDDFFDDDPTDELPVLSAQDSPATDDDTVNSLAPDSRNFDDDSPTGTGITALELDTPDTENRDSTVPRLEAEIQQLQARWQEIEGTLDRREARIQTLEDELAERVDSGQDLECELQAVAAERATIESAAADLARELRQRNVDLEQFSDRAEKTRLELEEQQSTVTVLQTELDKQRTAAENVQTSIESARLHNIALEELATLTNYIDGRKNDWHQSEQEIIQQRQTIDALQFSLTGAESMLSQKEEEKEALDLRIINLQQRLTTLENQEAEYRCRNDDLLLQLEQHSQDTDNEALALQNSLNAEIDNNQSLREALKRLEEEQRSQTINQHDLEEQLTALLAEAGKKDQIITSLENELQTGQQSLRTVLDEVDRLGSVEASIHKLDAQMLQQLSDETPNNERSATCLMVATDGNHVMKHPIYKDVITIGRSQQSDIQVRMQYVSRDHAHILTDDLGTVIEDLGSKNGIRVNSMRVEKRRLKHGDHIDIGAAHFKFIDLLDQDVNLR